MVTKKDKLKIKDANVVREHKWSESQESAALWQNLRDQGFEGHVAPFSTLIAGMGPHWSEGSFEALELMGEYAFQNGFVCCLYEEPDRCLEPFDAIGTMRNHAYMKALQEGYQYILYVDNDVFPEADVLYKMLKRQMPVLAPVIRFADGSDHGIPQAGMETGNGLAVVGSVLLSFLLIKTTVFLPWAMAPFWENAVGAAEPYHFSKIAQSGNRPMIDTVVSVMVFDPPHFPLDAKKSYARPKVKSRKPAERKELWTP